MPTLPRRRWFDRPFPLGLPPDAFPELVERLRGTPGRLEERTLNTTQEQLVRRLDGTWSIQENAGHLLDLEPLWAGRLDDFLRGATELRPTDLNNRRTSDANHNAQPLNVLLAGFRAARLAFVKRLGALSSAQLALTALHPRLRQPMNVCDHCYFVAEHDDHHLARITQLFDEMATRNE